MGGGTPKAPNYDEAARQGVYADVESYPLRALTEAAAKMGGKFSYGGKNYDFTGLGDADTARQMSDKMAQTLLDLQRAKGPEFVQQRIDELKAADPQGYAARKQLFDQILQQSKDNPDRPLADNLQTSIVGELQNAGRLDQDMLDSVQQGVRGGQVARGNFLGTAAAAQEGGAAVQASNDLRDQQQQEGLGFLNSGVTPEDVTYRRMQQDIGNLANYRNGTSPTAQFGSLSSAGNGAAAWAPGNGANVRTNPNAGAQGAQNALSLYGGQLNWRQNQVNPWVAGINFGAQGAGIANNAGFFSGWGGTPYDGNGFAYNPNIDNSSWLQ